MSIENIKEGLKELQNQKIQVKVNLGRNKTEIYEGFIKSLYPSLFTIQTSKEIKSYSYADILTKNVIILSNY